jgi:hypothetical protein
MHLPVSLQTPFFFFFVSIIQFSGLDYLDLIASMCLLSMSMPWYSLEGSLLCDSEKLQYPSLGSSVPGRILFYLILLFFENMRIVISFLQFFSVKFMAWIKWSHPVCAIEVSSCEFSWPIIFNVPVEHKSQRP